MTEYLDPTLGELLEAARGAGVRAVSTLGVEAARLQIENRARVIPTGLASIVDAEIGSGPDSVRVRIYEPPEASPGTVLYLHGGGWMLGTLDTHEAIAAGIALHSATRTVSVDYRLSPEHPHPAALDDAATALDWASREFPGPIGVAGDSAGGNLATVLARHDRDRDARRIVGQLLFYPVVDSDLTRASYREPSVPGTLSSADMAWFWDAYVPVPAHRNHPDVAPLRADSLANLAPAVLVIAGSDPLRDEGWEYARLLEEAQVNVAVEWHPGLTHAFLAYLGQVPSIDAALESAASKLGELLRSPRRS